MRGPRGGRASRPVPALMQGQVEFELTVRWEERPGRKLERQSVGRRDPRTETVPRLLKAGIVPAFRGQDTLRVCV